MPCKGCGSSTPGKTRCVVCEAKWCNSCLDDNAERRSSGWKCNGCIGISSKNKNKNTSVLTDDGSSDYQVCVAMRRAGIDINDSNKKDIGWVHIKDNWYR